MKLREWGGKGLLPALVVAAAAWWAIVMASSWNKSPTMDEIPHIGAGISYLLYDDFRMNPEHPPLMKALAALPVVLFDCPTLKLVTPEYQIRPWVESTENEFGYYVLYKTDVDPRAVMFLARMIPALVALLGGVVAWCWARRMGGGRTGAFLAASLLLFYPEYAGHGRFLTLDVPTAVACAAISLAAAGWWRQPDLRRLAIFAVTLAVGSQVKLPVTVYGVLTLGVLCLLSLVAWKRIGLRRFLALLAASTLLVYFAAWAGASFRFSHVPPGAVLLKRGVYVPANGDFGSTLLGRALSLAWHWHLLPEISLATMAHVASFDERLQYFMGTWSRTGWYSYFFVTIALKTPLVLLVPALAAFAAGWVRFARKGASAARTGYRRAQWLLLWGSTLVLFALTVNSRINLGHRYVLFVYPPLCITLGVFLARWGRKYQAMKKLAWGVFVANLFTFAFAYPNYETYFNELIRTPYRGMKYLADSNIDWGQDLPLLGKDLKETGIPSTNAALFTLGDPHAYGINDYRWILPHYQFVIDPPKAVPPDPTLPSIMTLNGLLAARSLYPGLYNREPDITENSVVIFRPLEQGLSR